MENFLKNENKLLLIKILNNKNISCSINEMKIFYKENMDECKSLGELNKKFIDKKIESTPKINETLEKIINERNYESVLNKKEEEMVVNNDKKIGEIKRKIKELTRELNNLLYEL
uniref:Uncharacterized protein n=1 Tax=viral metagenome TaxID=1070528 RepID=A0A6C0H625_9ZZZZ